MKGGGGGKANVRARDNVPELQSVRDENRIKEWGRRIKRGRAEKKRKFCCLALIRLKSDSRKQTLREVVQVNAALELTLSNIRFQFHTFTVPVAPCALFFSSALYQQNIPRKEKEFIKLHSGKRLAC